MPRGFLAALYCPEGHKTCQRNLKTSKNLFGREFHCFVLAFVFTGKPPALFWECGSIWKAVFGPGENCPRPGPLSLRLVEQLWPLNLAKDIWFGQHQDFVSLSMYQAADLWTKLLPQQIKLARCAGQNEPNFCPCLSWTVGPRRLVCPVRTLWCCPEFLLVEH